MNQALKTELPAPRIAEMPPLRLAGLSRRYPATPEAMQLLGKQWQELAHGVGAALLAGSPVMYGVHIGLFDTNEDEDFSGVEVGSVQRVFVVRSSATKARSTRFRIPHRSSCATAAILSHARGPST